MPLIPMIAGFVIALAGAVIFAFRPGFPFGTLVLGATIVAAMTGLAASALQFLPKRYFLAVAVVAGSIMGLLVALMLRWAEELGFGDVRGTTTFVWPVATVAALLLSRASGMRLPSLRRRRASVDKPAH